MGQETVVKTPSCTNLDNKHRLVQSKGPYYAECSDCGEKFFLVAETIAITLGLEPVPRRIPAEAHC